MIPDLNWWQQDAYIWLPNIMGSVLFLSSGHLAWIEVCHAHWAWEPQNVSWWVSGINMMGCLAFMISALLAFVPEISIAGGTVALSLGFTLAGATCFLLGALLLLPEAALGRISN